MAPSRTGPARRSRAPPRAAALALALAAAPLATAQPAAEAPPAGPELARRINARDDGRSVSRVLVMELTDARGTTRTRVARSYRRSFGEERRSLLFFEEPTSVKGTALLTWDHPEPQRDDEQWLYLPGLRKSRRIATRERGDSFLGTDLSFEDLKKETRVGIEDYAWRTAGEEEVEGRRCWLLEGTAVDAETARQLGYGRVLIRVDAELDLPRLVEYWDPEGRPLKVVRLLDVESIQGIWTPLRIEARSLRTGHATVFRFREVDYARALEDDLFTEPALRRGPPR